MFSSVCREITLIRILTVFPCRSESVYITGNLYRTPPWGTYQYCVFSITVLKLVLSTESDAWTYSILEQTPSLLVDMFVFSSSPGLEKTCLAA